MFSIVEKTLNPAMNRIDDEDNPQRENPFKYGWKQGEF
jgi:hypothetical protein